MVKCKSLAQQAFNKLVQSRLSDAPSEPFITVAVAIWYEGFVPDITQLTEFEEIARAGYLIEKLMTFHCTTRGVRCALAATIDELIRKVSNYVEPLPIESILNVKQFEGDGLALRWRINEDLRRQVQVILPFQTRQYAYDRREVKSVKVINQKCTK